MKAGVEERGEFGVELGEKARGGDTGQRVTEGQSRMAERKDEALLSPVRPVPCASLSRHNWGHILRPPLLSHIIFLMPPLPLPYSSTPLPGGWTARS